MTDRGAENTWFWCSRVFLAAATATFAIAVVDLAMVVRRGGWTDDLVVDAMGVAYLLGIGALGGAALGIELAVLVAVARLLSGEREVSVRHPGVIFGAAVAVVALFVLNTETFSGPAIRESRFRLLYQVAFYGGGAAVLLLVLRCVAGLAGAVARRRSDYRIGLSLVLAGAAAALYYLDATRYVGLYPQVHLQLAAGAVLALTASVLMLLIGRGGDVARRRLALALLIAAAGGLLVRLDDRIVRSRTAIVLKAVNVAQWIGWPERLLDRIRPLAAGDVGDVSEILRRRDDDAALARELDGELDRLVPGRRDLSLLIVSLDTVRPDHTSFAGYPRRTTPRLDELAARSLFFTRCYTAYPTSAWAYSAFLSGRHASCAPAAWDMKLVEKEHAPDLALPGLLGRAGFATAAESAFNRGTLARRDVFGHLKDGFASFNPVQPISARKAPDVTAAALQQLERLRGERFFLWVHYIDPHDPYTRNPEADFGGEAIDRYDSEIALVDRALGRLLDRLGELGAADRTAVLVMSDHGEEFGEHASRYHNTNLYEPQVRVPAVLHVPGLAPARVDGVTSLIDFFPTLTQLMGVTDPHGRNGQSLWPRILGRSDWPGMAFAELNAQRVVTSGAKRMIVYGRHKMIVDRLTRTEEVYDVLDDAAESENLVGHDEDRDALLRGLVAACEREIAEIRGEAEADPRAELAAAIAAVRAATRETRARRLTELVRKLTDSVYFVAPRFRAVLDEELRAELLELLRSCIQPEDPVVCLLALRLAGDVEARELLPAVQALPLEPPRVAVESFILRGVLGDATAKEGLERLMATDGIYDEHRIATALLALGVRPDLRGPLAAARAVFPTDTQRILVGLAGVAPEELLTLADDMLPSEHWRFGPVRHALARALARLPSSPRRDRLLAVLADDVDAGVQATAREALAAIPEDRRGSWLAGGKSEAEANGALAHRDHAAAIEYLEQALRRYPHRPPHLLRRLARLQQCYGDLARARELTSELEGSPPVEPVESLLGRPSRAEIAEVRSPTRALAATWSVASFRLSNTGARRWPTGRLGCALSFRVVLRDESDGKVIDASPTWDVDPATDVAPGGTTTVHAIFRTPARTGRFRLGLRPTWLLPSGQSQPEEPVLGEAVVEVVKSAVK